MHFTCFIIVEYRTLKFWQLKIWTAKRRNNFLIRLLCYNTMFEIKSCGNDINDPSLKKKTNQIAKPFFYHK